MQLSLKSTLLISLCIFAGASFVSIAVANIFLGISIFIFLLITYKNKGLNITQDKLPYFKAIGVFACALFISALFSGCIFYGLKIWGDFFLWRFIPFIILLTVLDEKEYAAKVLIAVMCGFVIDCLYAIYWSIFVYKWSWDWIRAAGFVGHPMTLAGWSCILLPIILVNIFKEKIVEKYRWLPILLFVIGIVALLFNATRGAWLALFIVLPIMSLCYVFRSKKVFFTFVSIVLVVGIVLVNNHSFMKRVYSITNTKNASNSSRFIIWDTSLVMFKEHPVLGVGLGNYKNVYQKSIEPRVEKAREQLKNVVVFKKLTKKEQEVILYSSEKFRELKIYKKLRNQEWQSFYKDYLKFRFDYDLSKLTHAHNNFIQMLAENGVLGFLAYIFAFGYILWNNLKNYFLNKNSYALMILGSTTALMLQGLTEYNFGNSSVMKIYWLVLACLIILAREKNK